VNAVQESTSRRRQIVEASTFVSTDLIDQHLLQPVKLHTMIHAYMTRLEKYMSALDDSIAMIEETLEQLSYRRIESLYNQLEVWTTYLREKVHRKRTNNCFPFVLFLTTSNFIIFSTCHEKRECEQFCNCLFKKKVKRQLGVTTLCIK
jgi:hypothetical protein